MNCCNWFVCVYVYKFFFLYFSSLHTRKQNRNETEFARGTFRIRWNSLFQRAANWSHVSPARLSVSTISECPNANRDLIRVLWNNIHKFMQPTELRSRQKNQKKKQHQQLRHAHTLPGSFSSFVIRMFLNNN